MQKQNGYRSSVRMIAALTAAVLLALLLGSSFFMIAEAQHDCTGEDCEICAEMEAVVAGMSRAGGALSGFIFLCLFFRLFTACVSVPGTVFHAFSLTYNKIRLNN